MHVADLIYMLEINCILSQSDFNELQPAEQRQSSVRFGLGAALKLHPFVRKLYLQSQYCEQYVGPDTLLNMYMSFICD